MRWLTLSVLGVLLCGIAYGMDEAIGIKLGTISIDNPEDKYVGIHCGVGTKFGTGIAFDVYYQNSWKDIELGNYGILELGYDLEVGYYHAKATGPNNSVTFGVLPTAAWAKVEANFQNIPLAPYARLGIDFPFFLTKWKSPPEGYGTKTSINDYGIGFGIGVGLSYELATDLWIDFSVTRIADWIISDEYEDYGLAGTKVALGVMLGL